MHRRQLLEQPPHAVGEGVPGRVHAGEQRVAARRRGLLDAQDAPHRRIDVARDVGVPQLARHELRVAVGVHDQDLGVLGVLRGGGVDVQVPEAATEGLVLRPGQRLVAEEQDQVVHQRGADGVDGVGRERPAQVYAGDLGADDRRHRLDPDVILQCGPSVFPGLGSRLHSTAGGAVRRPTGAILRRQHRLSSPSAPWVPNNPPRVRAVPRRSLPSANIVSAPGAGGQAGRPRPRYDGALAGRFARRRMRGGGPPASDPPPVRGAPRAALPELSCSRPAANVICTRTWGDRASGGTDGTRARRCRSRARR